MSRASKSLLFLILLGATIFQSVFGYPAAMPRYPDYPASQYPYNSLDKRVEFTSKGWGAGGMPFSVLYMHRASPSTQGHPVAAVVEDGPRAQALIAVKEPLKTPVRESNAGKSVPQVRAPINSHYRPPNRRKFSVLPQLFISHGWGPLGK